MLCYVAHTPAGELFEAEVMMFFHERVPLENFVWTHYPYCNISQGELWVIVL